MSRLAATAFLNLLALALLAPVAPPVYADPPEWAPAHGWREKHEHDHEHDEDEDRDHEDRHHDRDRGYRGHSGRHWDHDYDVTQGHCNREAIGTVLGGVVGGAVGSTVGKGDGKTVAIILGAVTGAVIGNRIGKDMDDSDRGCIGHALELAPNNRLVQWQGAQGLNYRVTPLRDYAAHGRKCREYRLQISGNDIDDARRERACLMDDGNWRSERN